MNAVPTTILTTLISSCSLLELSVSVIQLLDPPLSAGAKPSPPNTRHNCGCGNCSKCQCTLSEMYDWPQTPQYLIHSHFPRSLSWPSSAVTHRVSGKLHTNPSCSSSDITFVLTSVCRRWAYNWAHGSIGFILGLTTACEPTTTANCMLGDTSLVPSI